MGGSGRRGSEGQVVAHLAAQLPGWGDAELRRRGADLAEALTAGPVTPEEMNELARTSVDHAGSATFARGLFVGLGVDGVRWLISSLGSGRLGPSSDVARVLAGAFGAATPNDRTDDPVRTVLTATYVAPDDRHGDADVAAVGLAALLLARGVPGGGAVRPETAAGWTDQMLARERAQGVPAGAGTIPADWDSRALAPAELAFAAVAASGESVAGCRAPVGPGGVGHGPVPVLG